MTVIELISNFKEVGIAALFVWLLRFQRKDLENLRTRVRQLEDSLFVENKAMVKDTTAVITENTATLQEVRDTCKDVKALVIEHQKIMTTCAWQKGDLPSR